MDKKSMLLQVKADYEKMLNNDELNVIILERKNGTKSGIGNPQVKVMVLKALISEADRQLKELD